MYGNSILWVKNYRSVSYFRFFDKTIAIYRNAVHYISDIAMRHYDELKSLESITGDD